MEFRLTYEGPLRATQRDAIGNQPSPKASHKHEIRKVFHRQLKHLWGVTPALSGASGPQVRILAGWQAPPSDIASLAAKHANYGFNFVPLVTEEHNLICGLDILFLRPDLPGRIYSAGDIDNRLKTLFDALRIPVAGENYSARTPMDDEKPFFCLLEDDKLITKLSVETDQLLQELPGSLDPAADVRLVITVSIRPYQMHVGNMHLG